MTTDSTSSRVPGQVISPAAYAALGGALTAIIWNKDAFERHIRGLLRGHPELLVHLNFSDIKRVVADELVDQLMADEDQYQEFTLWLMNEVASMESFPNLERQRNDRALHLERAHKAIADLRQFTAKYAAERGEQQEMREQFAQWRAAAEGQQGFSRALEALKSEFRPCKRQPTGSNADETSSGSYTSSFASSISNLGCRMTWPTSRSTDR
jgi:hypothetical protein